MIISRTPFRISFFGGGTDYQNWYREHGGAVLVTTIDKYCYISSRFLPPFFEHKTRIAWSQIEQVKSHDEIKHPAVNAALKYLEIEEGLEIHHDGDIPARTGLGSSSSFTVGLLHSLYALKRKMPTKSQLALEAIHIERNIVKEIGGIQDQVATAFGGFNRISFSGNNDFHVQPIIMDRDRLTEFRAHLMLYFTGFSRFSSDIAEKQVEGMSRKRNELFKIREMVDEAVSILTGGEDLCEFGKLLDESWKVKKTLSGKISNPTVDEIYRVAVGAGVLGGKLLGAGGGGFMLFFARPESHARIRERLKGLLRVPFDFETMGSQIILYQPDTLIDREYPKGFRVQEQTEPLGVTS